MILKNILKDFRDYYQLKRHQENWIKIRGNNFTRAGNKFPVSCVKVGDYTYGILNIHYYNQPEEHLEIGRYCSIANNVHFFTGGVTHSVILRRIRLKTDLHIMTFKRLPQKGLL